MQKMILTGVALSAVFNFGMLLCLLPSTVGVLVGAEVSRKVLMEDQ